MHLTFRTFAIALALVLLGGAAQAADKGTPSLLDSVDNSEPRKIWSGFYVGAHGGYSFANTEVGITGSPFSIDGLGSDGWVGGVQLGVDYQLPSSPIVLGLFVDYTFQDVAFTINPTILNAELGDSWTVGGRVGWSLGRVLPYVLVGYTQTKSEISSGGTTITSPDLKGWTGGGGIEVMLANNVSLSGEYRFTKYDTEDLLGLGIVNLDTEQHSVMARLKLRTGAFGLFGSQ